VNPDEHRRPVSMVIDASIAIALVAPESTREALREVVEEHRADGGHVIVPDLFWLEVTNVLTRPAVDSERMVNALRALDEIGVESIGLDRPLLLLTIDLAVRHRLTAYDAAYLALAQVEDASLLTLDAALVAAAGDRAIRIPGIAPHRLAERASAYEGEPIDWSRFGRYLASLRAEAEKAAGV
jgi:predicted nucleic acid-binding protein